MLKINQRGFSALEGLLVLIIIGLVAFTGFYVLKANKDTDKTVNNGNNTSSHVKQNKTTATGSTFQFKELGIEFKKPDSLKGLSYQLDTNVIIQGVNAPTASLLDSGLTDIYNQCADSTQAARTTEPLPFAAISKVSGTYDRAKADPTTDGILVKQFDNFYITYAVPNGAICGSEDEALNSKWNEALIKSQKDFAGPFEATVEAIKS
jgi:type II secretory pathway pseudopilin PulG